MGFVIQNLLLGVGLAMDAFSVSLVSGLSEPRMKVGRMCGIAGVFAFFQAMMPMIGFSPKLVTAKKHMYAPTIMTSPWAKLSIFAIP